MVVFLSFLATLLCVEGHMNAPACNFKSTLQNVSPEMLYTGKVMFVIHAKAVCRHAPMCLKYMEKVKDRRNFRFCAIPQVMAVGTLALCFNNHKVFTGEPNDDESVAVTATLTSDCCTCFKAIVQDCFKAQLAPPLWR